jgi:hypothetical protein
MTQLFSDYQYLMKIWTVCYDSICKYLFIFLIYFQHPWLLQPYFIEHYNKHVQDDDQTEIDNISEDDFCNRNLISLPTQNILNINPEKNALHAMKEQWWFNIFDPNNSQFDVIQLFEKQTFL